MNIQILIQSLPLIRPVPIPLQKTPVLVKAPVKKQRKTNTIVRIHDIQVPYQINQSEKFVLALSSPFANPAKRKPAKSQERTNGGKWTQTDDNELKKMFIVDGVMTMAPTVDWDSVAATLFPKRTGKAVYSRYRGICRAYLIVNK